MSLERSSQLPGGFQVRHHTLGIYQGSAIDLAFWHPSSSMPEYGLCRFSTEESAQAFHCHLKEATELSPEDLVWRRVRRAIDGLQPRLVDMAADHFGMPALEEPWDDFCFGAIDDPLTEGSPHNPLFLSWLCHVWQPNPVRTRLALPAPGVTAARAFLDRHGKRLDPIARRYLEACAEALYSYYEVLSCDPGRGYQLKDLLLGDTRYVLEASGSQSVQRADLLFACLVEVDGICVMK